MDAEHIIYEEYEPAPVGLKWEPYNEYGFTSVWAPNLLIYSPRINYFLSTLICVCIVLFFLISPNCQQWFVLPITFCGILTLSDVIGWIRKEVDAFDPKVPIAVLLFLNTFLTPLLHVRFEAYGFLLHTPNWPRYFGYMGFFNLGGVVCFKFVQNFMFNRVRPARSFWQFNPSKFIITFVFVFPLSLAASLIIKFFFGGMVKIAGERIWAEGSMAYAPHMSWLMMLGDPMFLLIFMMVVYFISQKNAGRQASIFTIGIILFFLMVCQFIWFGARASRMAILMVVVIGTIVVHYRLRPLSVRLLLIGICCLFSFVYIYTFYKFLGPQGWGAVYRQETRESLRYEHAAGTITPMATLLGDFARADVQATMIYRLTRPDRTFVPVHGRTYIMSLLTFIPRAVWKSKPEKGVKVLAGSEILGYQGLQLSRRQYGLAGEAMLNFGYYGIIPAFVVLGLVLGFVRKKISTMEPSDSRFYLVPIVILLLVLAVNTEAENLVFNMLKMGVMPFIIILLGSTRMRFEGM